MGDIAIDWGAGANQNPQGALGVVNQGYVGAEEGYKLGQQKATIHALQGIDLNDPKSIDAGIGNLVHANAMEQGNALQNLSWTRYLRAQAPAFQEKMAALGGDKNASSAADPDHIAHAVETYKLAKSAADTLADTPEEDRPAAFATIKADLVKRGVPEEAIDSAGQHLSGDGPKQLSDYYGGLLAHAQGSGALPDAHPSTSWSAKLLNDPGLVGQIGYFAKQGLDYSSLLDTAKAVEAPELAKQAEARHAEEIAASGKRVEIAGAGPLAVIDAWKAGKVSDAQLPAALKKAQAEADISAAHGLSIVPVNDASGNPTGRTQQLRTDEALQRAGGISQSPADQASDVTDRTAFANNYKEEVNQSAITSDKNSRDESLVAARMAQTLNPSNLTPWIAKNANTLNGLGIKIAAKDANNLQTYQTLVAQNLKSAIQVYPKNMGEFHAIQNAVADAKSPGDAAALALTENAAIHDAAVRYKEFRRDWAAENPNNTSEKAFQTAWSKQPAANQSMFASPVFKDLKFNGKPAVVVVPSAPSDNGRQWGIFMPGTPQATKFRVR